MVEPFNGRIADVLKPQIRPWVRYAARMIDVMFWAFPAGMLIGVFAPHLLSDEPGSDYALGWLVVVMWVFVEPLCLSVFGTTPGKWLLRIRLAGQRVGRDAEDEQENDRDGGDRRGRNPCHFGKSCT